MRVSVIESAVVGDVSPAQWMSVRVVRYASKGIGRRRGGERF